MSVSITIRDVPSEVRDELAARAAKSGRSLQEYLSLQLRELARRPNLNAALSEIRSRAHTYPVVSPAEVLDDLDSGRR
jgi:plasmid stability protein